MLRRNARLRREYLFRKSVQTDERDRLNRKLRIREALENGRQISDQDLEAFAKETEFGLTTELSKKRKREIELDSEYYKAGVEDPKILMTTPHDPSDRLKRFMKELLLLFPNSQKINRGKQTTEEIVEAANGNGFSDVIMVHETRGEPDTLVISYT